MLKRILYFLITINCFSAYGTSAFSNYLKALKNLEYNSAIKIANTINDTNLRKESIELAEILSTAGQYNIKIKSSKSENNLTETISLLSEGYNTLYTNPYSSIAFLKFNEAYKIASEEKNTELLKFCLISIIQVYNFEISQSNENVLFYLNEYKNLISDNADEFNYKINLLLFNLRDIFLNIKIDNSFISDFETLMNSFNSNHNFWPNYYSTVGVWQESQKNPDIAIKYHNKAINFINDEPFLRYIKFRSLIRLSEIKRKNKKYDEAIIYIEEASNYKDKSDSIRSNYYIHYYYSQNHSEQKNYKNAYFQQKKANELSTKMNYKKNSLEIAHLNIKYRTQEKELDLLKEQQKKKQNRNIAFTLGGLLFFGSLLFFLIQKNTKRKQLIAEQDKELEKQKVSTLLKDQEINSINAMIEGQEKERQLIANDLHDDLGGLMATVKLHFNRLKEKPTDTLYEQTNSLINDAYNKIRSIAHVKNSGVIAKQGLLKAVQNMAIKISRASDIKIEIFDFGLDNRLQNSVEITIFRMIQELTTNIIKHANATYASINLTNHEHSLNIMIEDNGKGFDSNKVVKNDGMGLYSIEKRIEHLEGTMTIESKPSQGTTIIIDIPL